MLPHDNKFGTEYSKEFERKEGRLSQTLVTTEVLITYHLQKPRPGAGGTGGRGGGAWSLVTRCRARTAAAAGGGCDARFGAVISSRGTDVGSYLMFLLVPIAVGL